MIKSLLGTYRDLKTFGDQPAPAICVSLATPLLFPHRRTLVMRIMEWFDMVLLVADQEMIANIEGSGGGS